MLEELPKHLKREYKFMQLKLFVFQILINSITSDTLHILTFLTLV